MKYIKSKDHKKGSEDLAGRIISELNHGKKVLWILTGGSSIVSCVEVLNDIKKVIPCPRDLTVTLTDERYGVIGHADSSWQKLIDSGFDFESVNSIPVLTGNSFEETAEDWEKNIRKAFAENDFIISQFGVGSDLHIAGILPESPATKETGLVSHYSAGIFDRITLSFEAIKKIDAAYVFIFGDTKKNVIGELRTSSLPLTLKPANILNSMPEVFVYSDQI